MRLDDVVTRAKNKSNQGRERRKNNFYNSPASFKKLIRVFSTEFRECGYGEPPPTTEKVRGMLSGFIKVCRSSHWAERKIYESVSLLVKNWDYIRKCEHHTLNGKKAALGDRPTLLEFLICRETMLSAIERSLQQKVEVTTREVKTIQTERATRFTPTEEEMQEEYNRLMEDM